MTSLELSAAPAWSPRPADLGAALAASTAPAPPLRGGAPHISSATAPTHVVEPDPAHFVESEPALFVPPAPSAESIAAVRWASATGPRASASLARRRQWERSYRLRLEASDAATVVVASTVAALVPLVTATSMPLGVPFAVAAVWLVSLATLRTRSPRITGTGNAEYVRVVHATGLAFGVLAIAFVLFQWNGLREQLLLALPVGLLGLLASRWGWRRWLVSERKADRYRCRTIVVGRRADVAHVISNLQRDGQLTYQVVGTALDGDRSESLTVAGRTYPTVASPEDVARVARTLGADTIIVASDLDAPDYARRLGWELEGTAADLVLSSRLTDVAGPRISLQQVMGLPLMQVRIPTFEGAQHTLKRALDIVVAALALVPIGLLTPLIAACIRLDSAGPVFFRQKRVGQDGREFDIIKFRTMRPNADAERAALADLNDGAGPLFKMRSDPRVTRVGAVLRKFSLDELPQFWNVLRGDMSVVGPRPPLPSEVGDYRGEVFRRLYIKPGITGLWQVSGRSDLSWDESVRLDLNYVENWSMTTDLMIICRTAKVVLRGTGAY